jgi:hypothetical protein
VFMALAGTAMERPAFGLTIFRPNTTVSLSCR